MEAKKIVHLQFKEPYNGETDFYFGSLKAIYDTVPIGAVGITYKSLTNATRGRSEYENKKVLIRIGQIQRKTRGRSLKSDLVTHLYFVDRAKAEAMYREKLAKVSFYRNGYIYLHTMKENADGVLDIDEVIDSKNF